MRTPRIALLSLTLVGAAVPTLARAEAPPSAVVAPAPTQARPLSAAETKSLAQREQKSKDLDKYEGGQVEIGVTTAAAVVILVLVLLLLL